MRRVNGGLAVIVFVVGAIALASSLGEQSAGAKTRKPKDVQIVQTEPLQVDVVSLPSVDVSTLPGVEVSSLPAVDVASLPAVQVSSIPAVQVSSLPTVTVGNASLDVRVTNSELPVAPAATRTVTPSDVNGVTLSSETVSAVIDCDGYREVSVFVEHDAYAGSVFKMRFEFGCDGVWAWQGADDEGEVIYSHRQGLFTSPVLGSQMRLRFHGSPFPTVTGVKVVVYLRP